MPVEFSSELIMDVTNFWLFPVNPYESSQISTFALFCVFALAILPLLCICPDIGPFYRGREAQTTEVANLLSHSE